MSREKYDEMRARYMRHDITHTEFYTWFGQQVGVIWRETQPEFMGHNVEFWAEKYKGDEHLNNYPLAIFDRNYAFFRLVSDHNGMGNSLSDCVCVYKTAIRNRVVSYLGYDPHA